MTVSHAEQPARTDDSTFQTHIVCGVSAIAELRQEWQALFVSLPESTWSYAPEVFASWIDTLRDIDNVRILTTRDKDGNLRGLYALILDFARRGPSCAPRFDYDPQDRSLINNQRLRPVPLRQLTVMASLPATMLWVGPLCQPSDCQQVYKSMAAAILGLKGWDVLILPAFEGPQSKDWRAAFAACNVQTRLQTLNRDVSNLRQIGSFQEVVNRQSAKFRQNVRRAQKVAGNEGMNIRMHVGHKAVAAQFETVATVARNSWKHQGRADAQVHIAYDGRQQKFFERLMASTNIGGTPIVAVASDAKGPVSVLTLLHFGSSVTALLTFWDGRLDKASPGLLLLGAAIDWTAQHEATRFEMNTTASWLRHLSDTTQTVNNIVVFNPGPYGRALGQLARLSGRLP